MLLPSCHLSGTDYHEPILLVKSSGKTFVIFVRWNPWIVNWVKVFLRKSLENPADPFHFFVLFTKCVYVVQNAYMVCKMRICCAKDAKDSNLGPLFGRRWRVHLALGVIKPQLWLIHTCCRGLQIPQWTCVNAEIGNYLSLQKCKWLPQRKMHLVWMSL